MCRGCCTSFIRIHAASGSFAQIFPPAPTTSSRAFPWDTIRAAWRFSRDGSKLLRRQPARRHHQRDRHAHQSRGIDHRTWTAQRRISVLRRGEQTFYTAHYSFQGQIGCANCHIDSTFDGLTWDLEPDGFGRDIVDNRFIEDIKDTEPYKWNGGNPNMPTECGPRTEKYFWRSENYDDLTLTDLVIYIRSLPPRPNRWRHAGSANSTAAQERGKAIFERADDKFGKPIPPTTAAPIATAAPRAPIRNPLTWARRSQPTTPACSTRRS